MITFDHASTITTLILIINLLSSTEQKYQKQSSFRSLTVPISVLHGVPYLQFRQICSAELYEELNNYNQVWWDQQNDSQFQQLNNYHQQSQINVLIDTGSNQFWLADSACQQCTFKKSLCPHLVTSQKKVSYMKGFIEGIDSYLNICGNRIKYLCVKSSEGLSQLKGQGILGLRHNSYGINILKKIIKKKSKQKLVKRAGPKINTKKEQNLIVEQRYQFSFDYGTVFNYLIIREIKSVFLSVQQFQQSQNQRVHQNSEIVLLTGKNWQFLVGKVMLFNSSICQNCNKQEQNNPIRAYIDTGSSKIVFSTNLCIGLLNKMQQKLNASCKYEEGEGIDCDRIIKILQLQLFQNQSQPSKRGFKGSTEEIILQINSNYLIDQSTNRINIICQSPSQPSAQQKIILGYPFLRSYLTTFGVSKIKSKQTWSSQKQVTQNRVSLRPYSSSTDYLQLRVLKIVMVGYVTAVIVTSWAFVVFLDFVSDKRSKKIII